MRLNLHQLILKGLVRKGTMEDPQWNSYMTSVLREQSERSAGIWSLCVSAVDHFVSISFQ